MNPKRGNIVRMMKEAGVIDPSPYVGAWENQLLAQERFAHLVIADFLIRTGQYITMRLLLRFVGWCCVA